MTFKKGVEMNDKEFCFHIYFDVLKVPQRLKEFEKIIKDMS